MGHRLIHDEVTESVIGAFYEVYNTLGFGFLEHIYMTALERELIGRGHRVAREACIRVRYKGQELGQQRVDMIVDERIIVEAKSTNVLHRAASRQVFNYLRASNIEIGLLYFGPRPSFFRLISSNKESAAPITPSALMGLDRFPRGDGH